MRRTGAATFIVLRSAGTAFVARESGRLIDRMFGGRITPLVAHLAEQNRLTPADIEGDRGAAEGAEVMIGWAIETGLAMTALALLVLIIRRPVAQAFGARWAYALWLLPLLRLAMPPVSLLSPDLAATLPPIILDLPAGLGQPPRNRRQAARVTFCCFSGALSPLPSWPGRPCLPPLCRADRRHPPSRPTPPSSGTSRCSKAAP
jgi:hypothetical protein